MLNLKTEKMDLRSKDAIESSKQHDIKIGNILIAEFMEVHEIMHDEYSEYDFADNTLDVVHENELKYHLSWDWLMPVLKKINLQLNPDNYNEWRMINKPTEYDIENVHAQAVYFIKNQNN